MTTEKKFTDKYSTQISENSERVLEILEENKQGNFE
jgi:hypothetical protein